MRKVLVFTPPYHTGIIEITGTWPPVGLLYIAGALKKAGYEVELCDLMTQHHDVNHLVELVKVWQPDAVLSGAFTPSIGAALECLYSVKKYNPSIITVLGGVHATFSYQEILEKNNEAIDYIVMGEGEVTCPQLLNAICSGETVLGVKGLAWWEGGCVKKTDPQPLLDNLDEYEPAWELLDWSLYRYRITDSRLALINTSRGCNYKCRFCSQHLFWRGEYRYRSPESVVNEIIMLKERYGVQMCMISDEYPTLIRERWEEILDRLIEAPPGVYLSLETRAEDIIRDADILDKYRQAGVIHLYVGVESTYQEDLDFLGKELKANLGQEAIRLLNEAGIITECSFILGSPEETPEHINSTLRRAIEYNPDLAHFLLLTPWPYTEIYNELKADIIEYDLSKYHFVYPIIQPKKMAIVKLWSMFVNCYRVFYQKKTNNIAWYSDPFKKRYMQKSIDIMNNEFFKRHFQ